LRLSKFPRAGDNAGRGGLSCRRSKSAKQRGYNVATDEYEDLAGATSIHPSPRTALPGGVHQWLVVDTRPGDRTARRKRLPDASGRRNGRMDY
jgi:hypothetical protein